MKRPFNPVRPAKPGIAIHQNPYQGLKLNYIIYRRGDAVIAIHQNPYQGLKQLSDAGTRKYILKQ